MKIRAMGVVPLTTVTVMLSMGSVGCSKKPAEAPQAATAEPASAEPALPGKDPQQAKIVLSPGIAEACGIKGADTFFDYNSARVSPAANQLFTALVECFTNGPLAGKTMSIVGHADPRGDDEYNMTLGGNRADNVAAALVSNGLPARQKQTSSRGELDASGTDESSWAIDRKVEISLAQ